MFFNVKNYWKILKMAKSCKNKDHVEVVVKIAKRFRRCGELTEFEYLEIERSLLEVLKVDSTISRWRNEIDFQTVLKKSKMIQSCKIRFPI